MKLENYFKEKKGIGIIATSDSNGVVDTAIYAYPHIKGIKEVSFLMRDRLTHKNLQENGNANYLFMEEGNGYHGIRMFLSKIDETEDHELVQSMMRRNISPEEDEKLGPKFLVTFKVEKVLNLIGGKEITIE